MYRCISWRGLILTVVRVGVMLLLALGTVVISNPARASTNFATSLCGDGSAPDYGFTYALQQPHWTVNWQDYASEQAVNEVDVILDRLNHDSIAQTMILFQPQTQVGNRVNCAVHFLRYMQLGLPTGERKDNGFVFLIVVEPTRIDVHYGVGLGLPALTAYELTTLNRSAEAAYQDTHSMDQALLTLVQGFESVARSKYPPLISLTPTPEANNLPQTSSGPLGILAICGQLCLGILLLLFLLWVFSILARNGITFNPSDFGSGRSGFPLGGGRDDPSMRGGGGSGRSGRGN